MVSSMTNLKGARLEGVGGGEYLGLEPVICGVGNVVVVCMEVKVPLVLRRWEDRKADGEDKQEFLGGCYVHGAVEGEVRDEDRCEEIWVV